MTWVMLWSRRNPNELLSRSEAAVIGVVKKDALKYSSAVFVTAPFTSVRVVKDDHSGELDSVLMAKCRRSNLPGDRFLLLRAKDRSDELRWKVKLAMTDETVQHLVVLSKADLREVERLEFFCDFLGWPSAPVTCIDPTAVSKPSLTSSSNTSVANDNSPINPVSTKQRSEYGPASTITYGMTFSLNEMETEFGLSFHDSAS